MSKVPMNVMHDFVRRHPSKFENFINSRNSTVYTPDISWISRTETHQKNSSAWLERKIQKTKRGLIPRETLRVYRRNHIPLDITVSPATHRWGVHRSVSLPDGSYVFVRQVLSHSAKVCLSISSADQKDDPTSLTIVDAWNIVAGPALTLADRRRCQGNYTDHYNKVNTWMGLTCEAQTFQLALSRILQDGVFTKGALPVVEGTYSTKFTLRLYCELDSFHIRYIEFGFSSDIVQQYSVLSDFIKGPVEVYTCIAAYLE
jgi:hypothetical protein